MTIVNEDIRAQVKATMKAQGITQEALAKRMGVNRVYVNRMLSGDTSQVPGRWDDLLKALKLRLIVEEEGTK